MRTGLQEEGLPERKWFLEGSDHGSSTCRMPDSPSSPSGYGRSAELLESEHLADIFLVVEGQRLPAHKAILFGRCMYFRRMFSQGSVLREAQGSAEVELTDVPLRPFRLILRFIYSGEIGVLTDGLEALEVLRLGDYFNLTDLLSLCANELHPPLLDLRTALRLLSLAHPHVVLWGDSRLMQVHPKDGSEGLWAKLWQRATEFVDTELGSEGRLNTTDLGALEELSSTEVARHALQALCSARISVATAGHIICALQRGVLDLADLAKPFLAVNVTQTEARVEVPFTREHHESDHIHNLYGVTNLLGCIPAKCKVFPNGRAFEEEQRSNNLWVSVDCSNPPYGAKVHGSASVQWMSGTGAMQYQMIGEFEIHIWGWCHIPNWDMHSDQATVVFSLEAKPPPVAEMLVKGFAATLLDPNMPPLVPSWLSLALLRSVLHHAKDVSPARQVLAAITWARNQDDPASSRHQIRSVLEDLKLPMTCGWDWVEAMSAPQQLRWVTGLESSEPEGNPVTTAPAQMDQFLTDGGIGACDGAWKSKPKVEFVDACTGTKEDLSLINFGARSWSDAPDPQAGLTLDFWSCRGAMSLLNATSTREASTSSTDLIQHVDACVAAEPSGQLDPSVGRLEVSRSDVSTSTEIITCSDVGTDPWQGKSGNDITHRDQELSWKTCLLHMVDPKEELCSRNRLLKRMQAWWDCDNTRLAIGVSLAIAITAVVLGSKHRCHA